MGQLQKGILQCLLPPVTGISLYSPVQDFFPLLRSKAGQLGQAEIDFGTSVTRSILFFELIKRRAVLCRNAIAVQGIEHQGQSLTALSFGTIEGHQPGISGDTDFLAIGCRKVIDRRIPYHVQHIAGKRLIQRSFFYKRNPFFHLLPIKRLGISQSIRIKFCRMLKVFLPRPFL